MKRCIGLLLVVLLGCGAKTPALSTPGKAMVKKMEKQMPQHQTLTFKQLGEELERMNREKKLGEEEYQALKGVCERAANGEWDRAEAGLKPLVGATQK